MSYVTAAGSGRKPLATEFVLKDNWNSLNLVFDVVDIVWHKDHWHEYYSTTPSKQTKSKQTTPALADPVRGLSQ